LSDEQAAQYGAPRPREKDFSVLFYPGRTTESSLEHCSYADNNHAYFEDSSEKAVTTNEDLLEAIATCKSDSTANPLKVAPSVVGGVARPKADNLKRVVIRKKTTEPMVEDSSDKQNAPLKPSRSDQELAALCAEVEKYTLERNIAALRRLLLSCDTFDVTLDQLRSTRVGIAVGNVLGVAELKPLHSLAGAVVSSWARCLPEETKETLRHQSAKQEVRKRQRDEADSELPEYESPPSLIARAFRTCDEIRDFPNVDVDDLAKRLYDAMPNVESRAHLVASVENKDHSSLRRRFLNQELHGGSFLKLTAEDLRTDSQVKADADRAVQNQGTVESNEEYGQLNELFECGQCLSRKCRVRSFQMRGGDEPMTNICFCTVCGHRFKVE
jgi:transcription elongation factor S-II